MWIWKILHDTYIWYPDTLNIMKKLKIGKLDKYKTECFVEIKCIGNLLRKSAYLWIYIKEITHKIEMKLFCILRGYARNLSPFKIVIYNTNYNIYCN